MPRLLIFDGHWSHITFPFIQFCVDHDIHLLCLPAHSTDLLQPLDVGLFSPYQHFYGLAVDKHLRSGQSLEGIKKAVFIPFLTEARDNTMKPTTIQRAFTTTGIWPLNSRCVLRKVAPERHKRRDTQGLVKNPPNAQDIRNKVKMGKSLLDLGLLTLEDSTVGERVGIRDWVVELLRDLGHQLETEIAEKDLYLETNQGLQGTACLYNTTDKRQLSVARVLDGAELIRLRDAHIEKDNNKKKVPRTYRARQKVSTKAAQKPKKIPPPHSSLLTPDRLVREVVIANTPMVMFIDSEVEDSEDEILSDREWDASPETLQRHPPSSPFQAPKSTKPDRPLHMSLCSWRS